jgi:hypothetical protein
MKLLSFVAPLCILAVSASAQSLYNQPSVSGGGVMRPSQLWQDPNGQNDLDSDAIAYEDFELPQAATVTQVRWWGQVAPPLGFRISFYNQDPGTTAVQPDIFGTNGPIAEATYTNFTQTSVGGGLYQFDVPLATSVTCAANTRYFIAVVGLTPVPYATWDWAEGSGGVNGTFYFQRGATQQYMRLPDDRAVALASGSGWSTGEPFCAPGVAGVPACPCANPGVSGSGCNNSDNTGGATQTAAGSSSLSADTLQFTTTGEKATALSIIVQGRSQTSGHVYGQGILCANTHLKRLYIKHASGGVIVAPQGGDLSVSAQSAALGDPIVAGAMRWYQSYYRDPTVLNGCPSSATFNASSGVAITWGP